MEAKVSYLQYLKISAKFIEPCSCSERQKVHTYCLTASIIREEKIYCAKCGDAFNLFIKQERVCSGKLISLIFKYCLFLGTMLVCAALFLIIDAYLKCLNAEQEPELAQATIQKLQKERDENIFNWSIVPDYTADFSITRSVRWTDMFHIVLIQIILMSWCFYYQFTRALMARKKLIYVEVWGRN